MVMIHAAYTITIGNAAALRRVARALDSQDRAILDEYVAKTDAPRNRLQTLIHAETFLPAAEAQEIGFIDRILDAPAPGDGEGEAQNRAAPREPMSPEQAAAMVAYARNLDVQDTLRRIESGDL